MSDDYLKRWSPELRRAVMEVRPEYFSWPQELSQGYAANVQNEECERVDQILLEELLGKTYRSAREAVDEGSNLQGILFHRRNEMRQPLLGIGEACFSLQHPLLQPFNRGRRSILAFPTLRALDEADYVTQAAGNHPDPRQPRWRAP